LANCEAFMAKSRLVQEFFVARQNALSDPETLEKVRQAMLAGDRAEVLAGFETRMQSGDEEQQAETIAGLKSLYGRDAVDALLRWIGDPSADGCNTMWKTPRTPGHAVLS
jgi:hypothetical protein